jgi:hypothetical protein
VNLRRGLFRVWIVASLLWFIGWLLYVWATCETKHVPGSAQNEPWKEYVKFCYTGFSEWMTQVQNFTFWDYASIGAVGGRRSNCCTRFGICRYMGCRRLPQPPQVKLHYHLFLFIFFFSEIGSGAYGTPPPRGWWSSRRFCLFNWDPESQNWDPILVPPCQAAGMRLVSQPGVNSCLSA